MIDLTPVQQETVRHAAEVLVRLDVAAAKNTSGKTMCSEYDRNWLERLLAIVDVDAFGVARTVAGHR